MIKSAVSAYLETEKTIIGNKGFNSFIEYFNKCVDESVSLGNYHMFLYTKDIQYLTGSEFED